MAHTVVPVDRGQTAASPHDDSAGVSIAERYVATCCRCHTVLEFEPTPAEAKLGWTDKADLLRCAHKWGFFRILGAAPRRGWLCPPCTDEVLRCLEGPE